jgi:hypothetical protein
MSATQVFHTTAPESGMITLPEGLRGKPLKIVVETETVSVKRSTSLDIRQKTPETGILSIAGILKDCPNENILDERYEYLMEKYAYAGHTD